jgi:alanyl-tRNA synthetase
MVADLLRVGPDEVEQRVRALMEESEALQRQLKKDVSRRAKDETTEAVSGAVDVGGVKFVAIAVDTPDVGGLRKYGDELRNKLGNGVGLVCQDKAKKPVVLIVVSDSLIKDGSITATDITKRIAEELSYRGGGKPHMAQVGIPGREDFKKIEEFVRAELENRI